MQNIRNLVFRPYSQDTLSCIISEKLHQLEIRLDFAFSIEERLLNYAARKLESMIKGDMRMVN